MIIIIQLSYNYHTSVYQYCIRFRLWDHPIRVNVERHITYQTSGVTFLLQSNGWHKGCKSLGRGAKVSAKLLLFQPETFALRVTKMWLWWVWFGIGLPLVTTVRYEWGKISCNIYVCRDRTGLRLCTVLRLESVAKRYFTKNTYFWHPLSIGESERMRFPL